MIGYAFTALSFLTKIPRPVVWLLVGVGIVMFARYDAKRDAFEVCEARNKAVQVEILKERTEATRRVLEDSRKEVEAAHAANQKLKEELARHERELEAETGCVGDDCCILDDDFRQRLQSIGE